MRAKRRTRRPGRTALFLVVGIVAAVAPIGVGTAQTSPTTPPTTPLVRFAFPQDDGTLTPYSFDLGYPLVMLVYDSLLWRDADGEAKPWLARSVETSTDAKQITLRLVPDVRWQDGSALTATDVAFTFAYIASHPHPRFTPEVAAVASAEATDRETVVLHLRSPSPWLSELALADVPILPAHIWGKLAPGQAVPDGLPVGSGPYKLVAHDPGSSYRFAANPLYFKGLPAVAELAVPVIGTAEATLRTFRQGGLDALTVSLPRDAVDRVERIATRVVRGPGYLGTVLLFNLHAAPFTQPAVRRALAKAIDRGRVADAVGQAVPADRGYLHPDSRWAPTTRTDPFNPQEARTELAALGVPPIEVLAPDNDPVKGEAARQVSLALQRAGIGSSVRLVPAPDLAHAIGEDGSAPSFSAAIWTSSPLASYAPDFLEEVFGSDQGGGQFNYGGYSSPTFDNASHRIATGDASTRRAAIDDALTALADDVPVVPLFFSTATYLTRPGVYDGWVFVKGVGILDKQSFLSRSPGPPSTEATTSRPPPVPSPEGGGSDDLPFGTIALVMLAAAVVVGAAESLRRRR